MSSVSPAPRKRGRPTNPDALVQPETLFRVLDYVRTHKEGLDQLRRKDFFRQAARTLQLDLNSDLLANKYTRLLHQFNQQRDRARATGTEPSWRYYSAFIAIYGESGLTNTLRASTPAPDSQTSSTTPSSSLPSSPPYTHSPLLSRSTAMTPAALKAHNSGLSTAAKRKKKKSVANTPSAASISHAHPAQTAPTIPPTPAATTALSCFSSSTSSSPAPTIRGISEHTASTKRHRKKAKRRDKGLRKLVKRQLQQQGLILQLVQELISWQQQTTTTAQPQTFAPSNRSLSQRLKALEACVVDLKSTLDTEAT